MGDRDRHDEHSAAYRVVWGLGRCEFFATAPEADARASELHAEMVEEWPLLAGTNDAALPRVIASETTIGQNLETTWEMRHVEQ